MVAASHRAVEWISFGSNAFNAFVPFYANIEHTPEYISNTTSLVTTESFYWANRQIGALADASFDVSCPHIARYQRTVQAKGREIMKHRSPERTRLFAKKSNIYRIFYGNSVHIQSCALTKNVPFPLWKRRVFHKGY